MDSSRTPFISDELLSAYVDGVVNAEERRLIEATVEQDADVAWRLQTLQQTVQLLRTLPQVSLPRPFTLSVSDIAGVEGKQAASMAKAAPPNPKASPLITPAQNVARPRSSMPKTTQPTPGWWETFVSFWQGGNPLLRNLAAVGATVWLALFGLSQIAMPQVGLMTPPMTAAQSAPGPQPALRVAVAPAGNETTPPQQQAAPTNAAAQDTAAKQAEPSAALPQIIDAQTQPVADVAAGGAAIDASAGATMKGGAVGSDLGSGAAFPDAADPLQAAMQDMGSAPSNGNVGVSNAEAAAPAEQAVRNAEPANAAASTSAETMGADLIGAASEEQVVTAASEPAPEAAAQSVAPVDPPAPTAVQSNEAAVVIESADGQSTVNLTQQEPAAQPTIDQSAANQPAAPPAQEQLATMVLDAATAVVVMEAPASAGVVSTGVAVAPVSTQTTSGQAPATRGWIDPVRLQFVQLGLALLTALCAGLWLFSHRFRRSLS